MWNINKKLTQPLTKNPPTATKKKSAYITMSFYFHGWLLFIVLSNWQLLLPDIIILSEQKIAQEYTQTSRQRAMQERVDDMEAVKKMLDQLQNQQDKTKQLEDKQFEGKQQPKEQAGVNSTTRNKKLDKQQVNHNKELAIDELYKKSEQLLSDIKTVEQDILKEKLKALAPTLSINEALNKVNEDELMVVAKEALKKLNDDSNHQNDSATEIAPTPEPILSDEEKQQKTTDNQLSMRNIFEKIQLNQQRQLQGNSTFNDSSSQHSLNRSDGFSGQQLSPHVNSFPEYDTNSPLSVENYFSKISQGNIKDVSQEMQRFYQKINKQNGISVASIGENISSKAKRPNAKVNYQGYFTRKIIADSQSYQWLVLNSWYFIGPFPNNNRENIHTRFPPEVAIDLNAMYQGKYNRLLKWQHIQYDHLPIIPPNYTDYAVYYAYCEFYSDSARDVWLAIGSDDQSKMWINKMLVWQSSPAEKAWQQDEGHRKVSLKKGLNKLLFRLENGVDRAAFSILMSNGKPN